MKIMRKEKLIKVGSRQDKIFCVCGEKMIPTVCSATVQYRCPKVRIWNFWNHSLPKIFDRK
jgi:hypothetical protein